MGFSFFAGSNVTDDQISLNLTVDSGSTGHFVDSQLLPNIESLMVEYVHLDPPMTILTAARHLLQGTAKGFFNTVVIDS